MSLKQLFQTTKKSESITNEEINQNLRSDEFINEFVKSEESFTPQVDFSNPANFAFFGSAEKYYTDAFDRILNLYPYDGSTKEKLEWRNNSTLIDQWVFDNKYPKTTGYATFSSNGWGTLSGAKVSGYGLSTIPEYIFIKGVMNTGSTETTSLKSAFEYSNKYDTTNNRSLNLKIDGDTGFTIEFWLNKNSFDTSKTAKEVIFDLWNNELSSSSLYGRFTLEATSTGGFLATLSSGSNGASAVSLEPALNIVGEWHHYAFSVINSNSQLNFSVYRDGIKLSNTITGTSIGLISGAITAQIGSLRTAVSGTSTAQGYGKLSGSIDEFRFWRAKRTSQDIGRYWWTNVDGGSNTDDYATNLGVYYKFNEGIVGTASRDQIVIDYSGRTTNGYWYGYGSTSRNTGSGISLYTSASYSESGDPVLYSTHSQVAANLIELQSSGSLHDSNNSISLYKLIPSWITEEDEQSGEQLSNLTQIICSYFDTLYLQIQTFTKIKDNLSTLSKIQDVVEGETELNEVIGTSQANNKPLPFAKSLLMSNGIIVPDLFADASSLEKYLSRNEEINFDSSLNDIKNNIYNNIYSTLINAFKTKGTKKSYKNILHSFGIDEKLIKINTYPTNTTFLFGDNATTYSQRRKFADFNAVDNYNATVHQYYVATNPNSISFISGSAASSSVTIECETIFPLKIFNDELFDEATFIESSIFGAHTPSNVTNNDYTWNASDYFNFVVKAKRPNLKSKDAYFELDSTILASPLTTSLYYDVYENEKWNFTVKLYPKKNDTDLISGLNSQYVVEFQGINAVGNTIQNSFKVSTDITNTAGNRAITANKRLFAGAHKTNFTGSTIDQTDIKVSYLRYWASNLDDESIQQHAFDSYNYGTKNPANSSYLSTTNSSIPQIETLVLNWSFNNITGSDINGEFTFQDLTSGSINQDKGYTTWFNNISKYEYTGRGYNFLENSTNVVSQEYVVVDKLKLPETINSSNMINILTEDDEVFTSESRPEIYVTRFEKSMYQNISEEMINMFGTLLEFNNYVGRPIHKYRTEYKDLRYLRELFYSKVQNEPDLDKYLEFYKWFDDSIGIFLAQLTPATAHISSKLENTIESHILERQKYQHKYPKINSKTSDPEAGAQGINKHLYNWKFGHRPVSNSESENNLYWKELSERPSGTRASIHSASLQVLNRRFTTSYNFNAVQDKTLKGGVNFEQNKKLDFVKIVTAPHGALDETETAPGVIPPANVLFMGIENSSSIFFGPEDVINPTKKKKYNFTTINVKDYQPNERSYSQRLDSTLVAPLNMISASIDGGYHTDIATNFRSDVLVTNIHNDTYGDSAEIPMQGPFTNQWVGGNQARHIDLNTGNDSYLTRPEAWKIVYGAVNLPDADGNPTETEFEQAIGFVGADYPYPEGNPTRPSYPVVAHKRATYIREELAKRPVNIKNIKTVVGSAKRIGNYTNNYEVVHTFGRTNNNRELIDAVSPTIQTELSGILRTNTTTGRIDFALSTRQVLKTVVGARFSSPGGYRYTSRGYLNKYAEELSVYNALSFRNREIIGSPHGAGSTPNISVVSGAEGTGSLLSLSFHSELGYLSGTSIPSFHKINKNPVYSVSSKSETLEANYDNGYIQHSIPQNDAGYVWIRESLRNGAVSGNMAYIGHNMNYTVPSGSTTSSATVNYTFLTESVLGINSGAYGSYYYGSERVGGFTPVDFVGLNNVIKDPLVGTSYPKSLGTENLDSYLFDGLAPNTEIVSAGAYDSSNIYPISIPLETSISCSIIGDSGTKLYALTTHTTASNIKRIYQFSLSTPWEVNTATYQGKNKNITTLMSSWGVTETGSVSFTFSQDGTSIYVLGLQTKKVYQGTLTTPWDITTISDASITSQLSISSYLTASVNNSQITFNPTFDKLYFTDPGSATVSNNKIYQYNLSSAGNLSTATYNNVIDVVSAMSAPPNPIKIEFNSNGTSVYYTYNSSSVTPIIRFDLSTAYDLSSTKTLRLDKNLNAAATADSKKMFTFKNDYTRLYVLDSSTVNQYDLNLNYDYYPNILNGILLNRNGGYGYPSFKQIRTGETKTVRDMKRNSYISTTKKQTINQNNINQDVFINTTIAYKEPAVTISKPIAVIIKDKTTNSLIFLKHTDINNIILFANNSLNANLGLFNYKDEEQPIDKIIQLLQSSNNTRFILKKMIVSQDIYPKSQNIGFERTRTRTVFSFPYNVERTNRDTTSTMPLFMLDGDSQQNINTLVYEGKNGQINRTTNSGSAGIFFKSDGQIIFNIEDVGTKLIKATKVVTPWDITTIGELSQSLAPSSSHVQSPSDIFFNSSGDKMFVLCATASGPTAATGSRVVQYNATIPWSIDAANLSVQQRPLVTGSFPTSSPKGMFFDSTGTKLYVVGSGSFGTIQQFTLGSSYTLPANFSSPTLSNIYAPDTNLSAISFTNNGKYCHILGETTKTIYEYSLATAWDITSCELIGSKSISEQFSSVTVAASALFFKQDKRIPAIYAASSNNSTVYQYYGPHTTADNPTISQSIWPLDGASIYTTSSIGLNSVVGILQNNNTYVSGATGNEQFTNEDYLYPSPLLSSKLHSYSYYSVINPTLPDYSKLNVFYSASLTDKFSIVQSTIGTSSHSDRVLQSSKMFYNNTPWTAASLRGKGPYVNSYRDSSILSVVKSKEHTLIPEYLVSNRIKDYKDLFNNSTTFIDSSYLSITGSEVASPTDLTFYEIYAHSNDIERMKDINQKVIDAKLNTKKSLKLSFESLMKFTPYEGFYPVQRTLDIVEQFNESYGDNIQYFSLANSASQTPSSGSETYTSGVVFQESKQYGLRSFITPLFAPGLLYNTIKAGVAVDYPIITGSVLSSSYYFVSGGASTNRSSKTTQIANTSFDLRLPFETLIEPENYIKNINIIDQLPSSSIFNMALNVTSSWNGNGTPYYKYMINNFLGEIPNFFLQNNKLSSLKSNVIIGKSIKIEPLDVNKEFSAIVKIKKTVDEQPKITADIISTITDISSKTAATELLNSQYNYPRPQKFGQETLTVYSNPSAFGPMCASGYNSSSAGSDAHYTFNVVDGTNGFNPSFTPPYYDGESWIILKYKPTAAGTYSLEDIVNNISSSYLRYEFNQYSGVPIEQGFYTVDGVQANTTGPLAMYSSSAGSVVDRLNANAMQASASIFLKIDNIIPEVNSDRLTEGSSILSIADKKQLVISTKFETPILDFDYARMLTELSSSHIDVMGAFETNTSGAISSSTAIPKDLGIWHQYGLIPRDNAGIYLTIEDIPDSYKKYGREIGLVLTASSAIPNRNIASTGSLLSLLGGFQNTETKVGNIADSRVVKEAIIAIPFTVEDDKRKFFELNEEVIKNFNNGKIESISESVLTQLNAMKEYIFPPQFDFLSNPVTPISMYVFEFTHKFSKKDLQDMWQNITPELGESDKWKIETKTIKHEIKQDELLTSIDNVDNIRWLIFKVKQRAIGSYYEMLGKNFVNKQEWVDTSIPKYTYNWPYDYFSIIETGKLTAELEIESNE